jgi:hypothetical protein
MNKPQNANGYEQGRTELAEMVLLEVWSKLGEYRDKMVLIGGLVPRYLVDQSIARQKGNLHCGSMDVDLGVSIAVADHEAYKSIRATLESMDFKPGKNDKGNDQLHSFVKSINGVDVNVDFLTTTYGGPSGIMRDIKDNIRAIQVEGLGLALDSPLSIEISSKLLSGGDTTEHVKVCRAVPFIVLKALAFEKRRERKDAYDLVYVLVNSSEGAGAIAKLATDEEKNQESFKNAVEVLRNRFRAVTQDGPVHYAQFVDNEAGAAAVAFAAVQEFLSNL